MKKKNKVADLSTNTSLYIADSYLVAAIRAGLDYRKDMEKPKKQYSGAACVAISSHAFAIEVYIKSLLYLIESRVYDNHDLMFLWNKLPVDVREWISATFEYNLGEDKREWTISIFANPKLAGESHVTSVKTGENSAEGIIKSHRLAFQIGRYAYELPASKDIKLIPHNIPALELVSGLFRSLAHYINNRMEAAASKIRVEGRGSERRRTLEVDLPSGQLEVYPEDAIRMIRQFELIKSDKADGQ